MSESLIEYSNSILRDPTLTCRIIWVFLPDMMVRLLVLNEVFISLLQSSSNEKILLGSFDTNCFIRVFKKNIRCVRETIEYYGKV